VRGVRVCEGVAGEDTSHGFNQLSSLQNFADVDGIPPLLDLLEARSQLQGRCQVREVFGGSDLAAFMALVLNIVPETLSKNICRQGRVRRPRGYGAIEVDFQEDPAKVKQEGFCSVTGHA
jgi:hypothetical protein